MVAEQKQDYSTNTYTLSFLVLAGSIYTKVFFIFYIFRNVKQKLYFLYYLLLLIPPTVQD